MSFFSNILTNPIMHWNPPNFLQNKFFKFFIKNWVCPNDLHQFLLWQRCLCCFLASL